MLAVIMAGGTGSRLNSGEKPLILVRGRPMISYVVDAFVASDCEPLIVTTPKTPMTQNWCRAQGYEIYKASGEGYIEDMVSAVLDSGEKKPLFVSVSDIPCITPGIIRTVRNAYILSRKDACSVWIRIDGYKSDPESMPYHEVVNGVVAAPSGLNILRGDNILKEQDEIRILIRESQCLVNVNTPADRDRAENALKTPK